MPKSKVRAKISTEKETKIRFNDSIRSNKFTECNDSPELNWSIELKLEASPTDPRKKQMTDQEIWIQHAAMNSVNAVIQLNMN
jgi:hypothetical protein